MFLIFNTEKYGLGGSDIHRYLLRFNKTDAAVFKLYILFVIGPIVSLIASFLYILFLENFNPILSHILSPIFLFALPTFSMLSFMSVWGIHSGTEYVFHMGIITENGKSMEIRNKPHEAWVGFKIMWISTYGCIRVCLNSFKHTALIHKYFKFENKLARNLKKNKTLQFYTFRLFEGFPGFVPVTISNLNYDGKYVYADVFTYQSTEQNIDYFECNRIKINKNMMFALPTKEKPPLIHIYEER